MRPTKLPGSVIVVITSLRRAVVTVGVPTVLTTLASLYVSTVVGVTVVVTSTGVVTLVVVSLAIVCRVVVSDAA